MRYNRSMEEANCSWCRRKQRVGEIVSGFQRLKLCIDCMSSLSNSALSQLSPQSKRIVMDTGKREAAAKSHNSSFSVPKELTRFAEKMESNADQYIPPRNQRAMDDLAKSSQPGSPVRDVGLRPKGVSNGRS